ncbi:MAG TPA: hypothetical protein VEL03_03600 [Streptosporangiaceae bacterium]|nr:hypothetical protein [Streptosporangiaceae bacterium]
MTSGMDQAQALASPATTGVVPDTATGKGAARRGARLGRYGARLGRYRAMLVDLARRHPVFTVVLTLAIILRIVVMIAYQPIFWFTDSASYLATAVNYQLSRVRPGGYPILLALLGPLHSFELISLLQAMLGLAIGVAIYALLWRRGLPGWAATLAAVPVLFDAYELQLEHMLMSDTLFLALVMLIVVMLCWNDNVSMLTAIIVGLLLGYATVVRSVGIPMLAVVVVCLFARRVSWRRIVALVACCALPILIYMGEYDFQRGSFAMTTSGGVFLYGQVMDFANCATIKPPPSLAALCDPRPQSQRRQPPIEYIWDYSDPIYNLAKHTPYPPPLLGHSSGQILFRPYVSTDVFTPKINALAEKFAERAILAQPGDYIREVASDTLRSFYWGSPIPYDSSNVQYLFNPTFHYKARWVTEMRLYEPGMAWPHAVQPLAGFLAGYQRYIYMQGPILAVIVLIGLGGVVARRRRLGGLVLLPWATGAMLLIVPPLTIGFNSRYVLATVPCFCLAAGMTFAKRESSLTAGTAEPWKD